MSTCCARWSAAARAGCPGGTGGNCRRRPSTDGQENRRHQQFARITGARVYFADPYSSWQKGSVEHANKLLRAYFPKGCDLGGYDQQLVEAACERLNKKPRKVLGYKSALQLAMEKGVITSRDSGLAGGALEG